MKEITIKSADEMKAFAGDLASKAKVGDVYCLKGNLGAGKTTFAQGFIDVLQVQKEPVTSPTFNLIQIYQTKNFPVYHCDFYRLKSDNEFFNLGLDDAFINAVTLIEWPDIAAKLLPKNCKTIEIETIDDSTRRIRLF